jgi:hypothetical protein
MFNKIKTTILSFNLIALMLTFILHLTISVSVIDILTIIGCITGAGLLVMYKELSELFFDFF